MNLLMAVVLILVFLQPLKLLLKTYHIKTGKNEFVLLLVLMFASVLVLVPMSMSVIVLV